MTRRERELRVIVRRHGVVAAEGAKDTDIILAWKIEVSTVILPANFLMSGFKGIEQSYVEPAITSQCPGKFVLMTFR